MLRKLLLPLAAVAVLGGCTTSGYNYRGGTGDYYYGRPSVEYRHHGSPYGYSPYGSHYGFGLSGFYGYPYYSRFGHPYYGHPYYGHSFYGHPYYGYPYRRPIVIVQPRPDEGTQRTDNGDRPPPWRDFNARRRMDPDVGAAMQPRPEPARPMPRASVDSGSRMEQMIRRSRQSADPGPSSVEP
ncbi:hypothetical protein ACFFGH_00420 [Lysobacter korlensis]|uniref:Lipoprotein n=1 Tax=Lysobacter korlensis TaxID=553636 RepID=A0ABV6RH44_9GAMM